MKTIRFTEEMGGREGWRNWRLGRSTGSKLTSLFSTGKGLPVFNPTDPKLGVYKLIAESWIGSAALTEEESNPELAMERGRRLEPEAIAHFRAETGKKVVWHNDDIGWQSEDDGRIAFSPDGSIGKMEAVEAKCLSAARHIQAFLTREVPQDYDWQTLQAFIVNTSLRTLYLVFYDPRFPAGLDFFYIAIKRKDKKAGIEALLNCQKDMLAFVREKTNYLTQFVKSTTTATTVVETSLARVARGIKERSV